MPLEKKGWIVIKTVTLRKVNQALDISHLFYYFITRISSWFSLCKINSSLKGKMYPESYISRKRQNNRNLLFSDSDVGCLQCRRFGKGGQHPLF